MLTYACITLGATASEEVPRGMSESEEDKDGWD